MILYSYFSSIQKIVNFPWIEINTNQNKNEKWYYRGVRATSGYFFFEENCTPSVKYFQNAIENYSYKNPRVIFFLCHPLQACNKGVVEEYESLISVFRSMLYI
jgi:hypothetical protein